MKSPTQQTLKLMRSRGYTCEVTERWCPFSKRRKDLFGFIDVLCIRGDETVAVQTTTASHINARIDKMRELDGPKWWLLSTMRTIVVHGWSKKGARGKRKLWDCREVNVEPADLTHKTLAQTQEMRETPGHE